MPGFPITPSLVYPLIQKIPFQGPGTSTQEKHSFNVDLFACPVCYEPLIRKGPPGMNL